MQAGATAPLRGSDSGGSVGDAGLSSSAIRTSVVHGRHPAGSASGAGLSICAVSPLLHIFILLTGMCHSSSQWSLFMSPYLQHMRCCLLLPLTVVLLVLLLQVMRIADKVADFVRIHGKKEAGACFEIKDELIS